MKKHYKVGSRGSELALRQTRMIIEMLGSRFPEAEFEIVEITTHGDRFQETPIAEMGEHIDRGIFNTGLEEAVLDGRADFATCSFKDVESELPVGLKAVSVGPREDTRDVLISRHNLPLSELPQGSQLATSSPRRTSQLSAFRPDFRFHPLRGNITTRAGEAVEKFDGVILAAAGMIRMGLQERITELIPWEILLPAAAQGAMGCEYLEERDDLADLISSIQDDGTELCVKAEKKLLVELSGGCFAPIGVQASMEEGRLSMSCRIVSLDGKRIAEDQREGVPDEVGEMVSQLARSLTEKGGREIIEETRKELQTG